MLVKIIEKIVERHHCPFNKELDGKISKVSKNLLFELETGKIPEKNEILNVSGKNYVVTNKIRMIGDIVNGKTSTEYFIVECMLYDASHVNCKCSENKNEDIPLVCDI